MGPGRRSGAASQAGAGRATASSAREGSNGQRGTSEDVEGAGPTLVRASQSATAQAAGVPTSQSAQANATASRSQQSSIPDDLPDLNGPDAARA
jgi:hypothetical protein